MFNPDATRVLQDPLNLLKTPNNLLYLSSVPNKLIK